MGNNNNKKSNMSDANLPNTMSSHSSNQTRSVIFVPHIYVNGAFLDHSVVPRLEIRIWPQCDVEASSSGGNSFIPNAGLVVVFYSSKYMEIVTVNDEAYPSSLPNMLVRLWLILRLFDLWALIATAMRGWRMRNIWNRSSQRAHYKPLHFRCLPISSIERDNASASQVKMMCGRRIGVICGQSTPEIGIRLRIWTWVSEWRLNSQVAAFGWLRRWLLVGESIRIGN